MAYATQLKRLSLTLNRFDFIRLHQQTQGLHAGIIVCTRDDADPAALAARIHAAIAANPNPEGQLIRIVRPER